MIVMWVVWLSGPDTVSWGAVGAITLLLTGFVIIAKVAEHLTRPLPKLLKRRSSS